MYIQIHAITTLPVHVPNRGGDGLAKRGVSAGIERQRISYQAQQYALRHSAEFAAIEKAAGIGVTTRTALVGERLLMPAFSAAGIDDAEQWSHAVMALWRKKDDKDKAGDKDEAKAAPMIVGEQEVRLFTAVILACASNEVEPDALRALMEKARTPKGTPEAVSKALEALKAARGGVGTDGALFGRMATGVAVGTVDRCVRFSDALTTHGITPVSDFFLATDDLKDRAAGEAGGSHINNREMAAGIFYRHIVIDTQQMQRNGLSISVVEPLIQGILRVSPVGNRSPARTVDALVEIGGQVRTMMDAFADPVSTPAGSVDRLHKFALNDYETFGQPSASLWLSEQAPVRVDSLARAIGEAIAGSETR